MSPQEPSQVQPKVKAATIGAGTGAVISTFLVWLLDEFVWKANESVPEPVVGMVYLVVSSALAFYAGWRTKNN